MEFIKGSWYKVKNYYIKFEKKEMPVEGHTKIFGETLSPYNGGYRYKLENYWTNDHFQKIALEKGPLEDLIEISEYLPAGHPDKIGSFSKSKIQTRLIELLTKLKIK